MRSFFYMLLVLLIVACSESRFQKVSVDPFIQDTLFQKNTFMLHPLTIKTETGYDGLIDSTMYWKRANVVIEGPDVDSRNTIRIGETKRLGDTVLINIYDDNFYQSHQFMIKVWEDKFQAEYMFAQSGPFNGWVNTITEQKLTFLKFPVKIGDTAYAKFSCKGFVDNRPIKAEGYIKTQWP